MKESFTEGYLDDAVGNVALIGAGEAAKVFIQWSKCSQFDVFTTTGGGEFQGKEIASISELSHLAQYDHIVIASQFVDEIVDEWLKVKKPTGSLYWFDFMYLRMANVESMSYNKEEKKSLYVLYDLEVLPATFDIATFLVRAELRRKELALDDLVLVVIGGNFGGLSARAYLNHGATQGEWRVHHVLLPIAQMLSSCSGVAYFSNKRQANKLVNNEFTFPEDSSNRADFYLYALAPLQMEFEQGN
ncbi:hypothetical protein, partial [Paraglaciecola sp.]|uniref:hypothetical protein n=1 Tax=Paraglaciecola sp. TaxID=1920173 RepID=UPI003EF6D667